MGSSERVAAAWLHRIARDTQFEEAILKQRFRHPATNNQVLFKSLPLEEQARIRARFNQAQQAQPPAQEPDQEAELEEPEDKGPWTERVLEKAKEFGAAVKKFIKEPEYRKEVKEAFVAKKEDFKAKLSIEAAESKEMLGTMKKVLSGQEVSDEEKKAAKDQLKDIGKMAVLTSVNLLPVGPLDDILLVVVTAGVKLAFPEFSWAPSAWKTPKEAGGQELPAMIADRMYQGVLRALENPPEKILLETLDELGTSDR